MKLFFREYGSGKPLIILHGLFGMSDHWIPLGKKFAEKYHVVIPDLRNHGQSPQSPNFNYDSALEDLVELMNDLSISSTNLIGHSMGGKLAMYAALKLPDRISSCIIGDISPVPYSDVPGNELIELFQLLAHKNFTSRNELQAFADAFTNDVMIKGLILKNIRSGKAGEWTWKCHVENILNNLTDILDFDAGSNRYEKPVLFLKGSKSDYITDHDLETIDSLFPDHQIISVPQAGHWLHAEQPGFFFDACLRFLDEVQS